ncbi:MAG: DNA polymerase III subunits gamma and tau [uncultured Thermomicrobiales bacterium]|uniref:DNA polymerase III subunit gamma/tau n=1 Tax=uncultured Thermomicrobiales bacterium TaxID=1645740 RepID=A0A6J4VDI5_9BACT|nr:MAG: DNA polymerase III subunits gamma and tau [uncultured Thermomicrobiales bacterium]
MIVPFPFAAEPSADLDVGGGPQPSNGSGAHVSVPNGRQETRSLYRKYRPQTFGDDDLVGQEPVVRTLRNALRLDRVAHAYLFCGPRGTGKTTTARLLAKAVNCLDREPDKRPCNVCTNCRAIASGAATDVVEIDAASNRGIDDIRELRERVRYAPAQLRVKFYIVDEAHQITGAAANAFLKTLEEPPDHTKFVLATTDPEELLPTIVSRCQRFDFRRIGLEAMTARLRTVADAERIEATDEALTAIARYATGSLRDALGLLDQLALYRGPAHGGAAPPDNSAAITADAVRSVLGVSRNDRVETLVAALADRDAAAALGTVNAAVDAGEDPRQLNRQLVAYLRVLLHQRAGGSRDADERAQRFALLREVVGFADAIGARGVISVPHRPAGRFGSPGERARFVDGLSERAVDAYGTWAAALPEGSAAVFLEPLNRYESSFLNRVGQAADIAQRIAHPRVLALADLFHMNIEEADLAAPIADAGPLLGHVHVADNNRLEPGAGCLDLVPTFAALAEIGYDGWVSLECGLSTTGDDRERVLAAAMAYLRDQWATADGRVTEPVAGSG